MQRTLTFLFVLASGFALTGCPEKKAEKEPPAAPDSDEGEGAAVEDTKEEEAADEKQPEEKKPEEKKPEEQKAADKPDEGGW